MFVGAVVLVAAGRMIAPPPEPARPRVEPEPAQIAAAIHAQPMPGGTELQPAAPQPAAPQGG
jgi:hypothetical protein